MIEQLKTIRFALEGWANHDDWVWPESSLLTAKKNNAEALTALTQLEAMVGGQEPTEAMMDAAEASTHCIPTQFSPR